MLSKKHCYDINYWLFDNVHNKLNIKEEDPLFYNIIDSVHSVWRDINESLPDKTHICKPDSTLMDMPVLKEFKHLFDFIENFAFFKAEAFKDTPKACTKYFKYLERSVQIYYAREIFCTNPESNMCNRYIDNYKSYNPKNVREELNVSKLIMGLVWYQCYRDVVSLFRAVKKQPYRLEVKFRTVQGDVGTTVVVPDAIKEFFRAVYSVLKHIYGIVYFLIFLPVLFILGPYVFFLLIYKFTPLGRQMLRARALLKKKLKTNISYEDIILLNGSSESIFSGSSSDSSYIVGYQASSQSSSG
ncbi:Plasmodium vivax Vir protein, putative [Plasmodium vivax]|nr:Plasmodium vivax Vir protein, putative [Plasmodium vivax]